MHEGASKSRRGDRRFAILDAARKSFSENGYSATSMSAIAAKVGGSKTSLWSMFPSKEELFAAVLDELVCQFRDQLFGLLDRHDDVETTLRAYARAMLGKIVSAPSLQLKRLIYAEVDRFPEIGRLFYERGPEQSQRKLATYLAEAMAAGTLRAADPLRAAGEFLQLCQAGGYARTLLKVGPDQTEADRDGDADAAVDTFLRAYRREDEGERHSH